MDALATTLDLEVKGTLEPPVRTALLGWSLQTMVALREHDIPFVVIAPAELESAAAEHDLPFIAWDFGRYNEHSFQLAKFLEDLGVRVTVPLYEETVEWAGSLNSHFRNDPRVFSRAALFRDKGLMKRKALMSGIRVGVFEEVENRETVRKFFKRVNQALLKMDGESADPVHLKPMTAAGSVGHIVIRGDTDIDAIPDTAFPCMVESHLVGQEFSCEAFVHKGKIRFLNITEYIRLGYSNFVPASPTLEAKRPLIREAIEQLIEAFGIEYGMIHPEYFITPDGKLNFGEVAARVPGGHIFDLIKRAYGFDPYAGFVLCSDPDTSEETLANFFPSEDEFDGYAGCLMVYPGKGHVTELNVPEGLSNDPFFEKHDLFPPAAGKVPEREGFGNHFGTIFLFGDDSERMTKMLREYEEYDFYR